MLTRLVSSHCVLAAAILVLLSGMCFPLSAQAPVGPGRAGSIEDAIFIVADLDRSVHFYRDVLGMPMVSPPNQFGTAQFILDLTDTSGAFRFASFRVPGSPLKLDLIEYKDTVRKPVRIPRFQDPGAISLILWVRDIDSVITRLKEANARTITNGKIVQGGAPENGAKVIFAQDPDGFFVGLSQRAPVPKNNAPPGSYYIADELEFTCADVDQMLSIYEDVLGFKFPSSSFQSMPNINEGVGTPGAQVRRTQAPIPDRLAISPVTGNLVFIQFKDVDRQPEAPRSSMQDPGTAILRIGVPDLDAMSQALKNAGLKMSSRKGPVVLPANIRVVIYRDPNNVFIELAQHLPQPESK
jgi:catechol 2,3-dioxygenase-like lactoylglutathione lyase family enzyme